MVYGLEFVVQVWTSGVGLEFRVGGYCQHFELQGGVSIWGEGRGHHDRFGREPPQPPPIKTRQFGGKQKQK